MRLPGFQGTHIPGEHRLVAPAPPQIIIPERKITSAEAAAKWHATSGGAVAEEEEAEAVLLTNLVAGWALTSNANQTLSSAGVVASGPLDLTAIGSPTYGANGAALGASDGFTRAASVLYPNLSQDFTISYQFRTSNNAEFQNLFNMYNLALEQIGEYIDTALFGILNDNITVTNESSVSITNNTRFTVFHWWNSTTRHCFLQVNQEAVVDEDGSGINNLTDPITLYVGGAEGFGLIGDIRYIRLWTSRILTSDERTWLYNAGAGRTDAEIAAYTG